MLDKQGSELVKGDKVAMTGEVIAASDDGKIAVRLDSSDGQPGTLVQTKSTSVTKQGDSDMTNAARRGFNSAFDQKDPEQPK